jgi:hypothetical protein
MRFFASMYQFVASQVLYSIKAAVFAFPSTVLAELLFLFRRTSHRNPCTVPRRHICFHCMIPTFLCPPPMVGLASLTGPFRLHQPSYQPSCGVRGWRDWSIVRFILNDKKVIIVCSLAKAVTGSCRDVCVILTRNDAERVSPIDIHFGRHNARFKLIVSRGGRAQCRTHPCESIILRNEGSWVGWTSGAGSREILVEL